MRNKFIFFLLLISVNASTQGVEKFMKLQRVFAIDTSFLADKPTLTTATPPVFQIKVPANKIWIVKNIHYTTNDYLTSIGHSTSDYSLSIFINNAMLIAKARDFTSVSNPDFSTTSSKNFLYNLEPIIISEEKVLKFFTRSNNSQANDKYRVSIYFSVEEYVVE
jgi:hypothetical protein